MKVSLAEQELESKHKDNLLKKVSRTQKAMSMRHYMGQGLSLDRRLVILGLSKHKFYNLPCSEPRGKRLSKITKRKTHHSDQIVEVDKVDVVSRTVEIKLDPRKTS